MGMATTTTLTGSCEQLKKRSSDYDSHAYCSCVVKGLLVAGKRQCTNGSTSFNFAEERGAEGLLEKWIAELDKRCQDNS